MCESGIPKTLSIYVLRNMWEVSGVAWWTQCGVVDDGVAERERERERFKHLKS